MFFQKTVILFENNEYVIKTNYDTFVARLDSLRSDFEQIRSKIEDDVLNTDTLLANDYYSDPSSGDYILARHLEEGVCLIYDKKTQMNLSKLEFERYSWGGALSGGGGRRFYIKGDLFLETLDWIS